MFLNFKITLRAIARHKLFSCINIIGLSLGVACCMLIFLFSKDELSYDRFHVKKDHIFRVVVSTTRPDGQVQKMGVTGMMPGPSFKEAIPEVEDFVRVQDDIYTVKKGTEVFDQEALNVDDNFLSVFSFPLVQGDPATALKDPKSLVLSKEAARKYFGTTNPIGQTLQVKTDSTFEPFIVSGIVKKVQNSSIKFDMLLPMSAKTWQLRDHTWLNFFLNTFLVLKPGADPAKVSAKCQQVFARQSEEELKQALKDFGYKDQLKFDLQSLPAIHLSKDYAAINGLSDASDPMYSYVLSAVALFIFFIACVNFINLTLARSLKRAREIGVRKVMGSKRWQLIMQFLGESFVMSLFAFGLGLLMTALVLPLFNSLAGKELAFSYLLDTKLVAAFVAIFVATGLLSGFYPALVLSRFNPVQTLYGRLRFNYKGNLSKALVVFQFVLSALLVTATLVIYRQFSYLTHFNLGYNDKNVLVVNAGQFDHRELPLFKTELSKISAVQMISADQGGFWSTHAHINGQMDIELAIRAVDEKYLPLMQIPLVAGRNFSSDFPSDSTQSVLVNQSFVKEAGWQSPLGQTVDFFYDNKKYTVVGVFKDYHYNSLMEKPRPQIMLMDPKFKYRDVYIRLNAANSARTLAQVQRTFKRLLPFQPFRYSFKEAENLQQYQSESRWKQILTFGAILTIVISTIGLFGLTALSAERRTKEIGIRKVLGASMAGIVKNLSLGFLQLVLLAGIIASPMAWWIMNRWLSNYPYRVAISGWTFVVTTISMLLLALITVSIQAVRSALSNPAESLRAE